MKHNFGIILLIVTLCLIATCSAWFYSDNFMSSSLDTSLYTNRSVYGNLTMLLTSGTLQFNGTNNSNAGGCNSGMGTYLNSTQKLTAEEDGYFSFRAIVADDGNIWQYVSLGGTSAVNSFRFIAGAQSGEWYVSNGAGSHICTGSDKAFDSNWHTFAVNVSRGRNSTGSAKNTTFSAYYDGALICVMNSSVALPLGFEINDEACANNPNEGNYHVLQFDNLFFTNGDYSSTCPAKPSSPVYALDNFTYYGYTDQCWWSNTPVSNILTSNGQLCYDSSGLSETMNFYLSGQGNFYSKDVFTEEFDVTISNGTYLEHNIQYAKLSGSSRNVATLDFFVSGSDTYLQYNGVSNGTNYIESVCTNCWNADSTNHVKIVQFGDTAVGYTILNTSSSTFDPVQPNTISIQINGGTIYFNIPIVEISTDESNIPQYSGFSIAGGLMCLDNVIFYDGFSSSAGVAANTTGIPFLQVGEHCNENWECFTQHCNYLHICDKKGFLAGCTSNLECMSGSCKNNVCTKPSIWQAVDQSKTDIVGSDTNSNNMIAVIMALVMGIATAIMVYNLGGGVMAAVSGGTVFVILLFFFTIVGWLSPWILVGLVIVMILVAALLFVMGSRGS